MIPLFKVEENKLTSLKGEVSSFYELVALDTEGYERLSLENVYQVIEQGLNGIKDVLKLYFVDGKIYFNSFSDFTFNIGHVLPESMPVKTIFGVSNVDVNFYENYLTLGNEYLRILSVKEPPLHIDIGDSSVFPDFVLNIKKISQEEAKRTLKMKRKIHFSSLFKGIKDIESDAAYNEAEELLERVIQSEATIFEVEMFFVIRGETKHQLDENTQSFKEYFKGLDGNIHVEERGLSYFFYNIVPGVMPRFRRKFPCESSYLSYLIPFHRDFVHDEGIRLQSRSGENIFLSIFNPRSINFNMLFSGISGEGKSMLANEVLDYELKQGTKAFVLDLGNSFRKTALYHGAEILSEKFNPMRTKNPWYLKNFIMAAIGEEFTKKQQGLLFKRIKDHVNNGISSFKELINLLEADFEEISSYFSEIEDFFTDENTPVSDFTYCDLTKYPDAIKAPLIIYLLETFRLLEGKRVFIIDECWNMLEKNAYFVSSCFRAIRKSLGSAIAISQNFDDFYQTVVGRAIIQCSYYKMFFRQKLASSEFISTHVQRLIGGVSSVKGQYSEAVLIVDNQIKIIRFVPTPLKYELYTSDGFDTKQQEQYFSDKGKYLPFKTAIHNFTSIKYPYWRIQHETL